MFDRMPDWDILSTVDADIFRQSAPPDYGNYVLPAKPPNADAVTQMHPDCHLHYGPGECSSDFFLNLSENNVHSPTLASHAASECTFPSVAPRVRPDFSVDNYGKLDCPSERGNTNPPLSSSVDLHVGSPYRKSVEIYETVDQIESRKRKKTSQVHKSSERRRRDRINEKMKTLQNLIPNCNKSDKASILGDAIEYLKILQHYVQMMTMGVCRGSFHSPPMQCMELGMGYGVGMVGMALPLISVQGNPLHHSSLSAASSLMSIPGIGAPQPFQIPVPVPRFFPLSTTPAPMTSPSNTNGVAISKKCRK